MSASTTTRAPAVELSGIGKRFPGVIANDDITFSVAPGSVHALVGENGAGKSTLMKILYGMQRPDEGTIRIDGEEVSFRSPKDAIAAGIGMVHQHFMLAGNLTVLENVILGSEPGRGGRIDFGAARQRIEELSRTQGTVLDPYERVETLSVGEKQRVEIVKVLYRGARILILDEPTGVLVPQEVAELFENLRELTAQGVTIIFISHKLDEVLEIADAITVMRRGRTVATVDPSEVTARQLAELMVGSELPTPETRDSTVTEEVALDVREVTVASDDGGRPPVSEVSFTIHKGEILGIAGVEGNGQAELIEALMGLRSVASGSVRMGGEDITGWDTGTRRARGVGYVPEDRHERGLLLSAPLWENAMLGRQGSAPFAKGPWIDRAGARERTRAIIDAYDVRTPGDDVPAYALSGGNQQKLIIGRELTNEPNVLIAAHPTRGVDVGAQAAIWEEMRKARAAGRAVLLLSADLEELIGLSDSLLVILRGRIVARLDPQTVTPEELGTYMTGAAGAAGAGGTATRAAEGASPAGSAAPEGEDLA
jgi:general nucleoside transport system ATP-binding protein